MPENITIKYREYSDENILNFNNALANLNFDEFIHIENANIAFQEFQSSFIDIFDVHFPLQIKTFLANLIENHGLLLAC